MDKSISIDYSLYVDYILIAIKKINLYEKERTELKKSFQNTKKFNEITNIIKNISDKIKEFRKLLIHHQIIGNVDKKILNAIVGDKAINVIDYAINYAMDKINNAV